MTFQRTMLQSASQRHEIKQMEQSHKNIMFEKKTDENKKQITTRSLVKRLKRSKQVENH